MIPYDDLHWKSLSLLKSHLYSRLVTALDDALGRAEIAQHVEDADEVKAQLAEAMQGLAMALNLLKAWSALIHVKLGGTLDERQRRVVALDALPAWLAGYIAPHMALTITSMQAPVVHPETFYESVILMAQAGAAAGSPVGVMFSDARGEDRGVWLRVVFRPKTDAAEGRYGSLDALRRALRAGDEREQAVAVKLAVLADLCRLNGSELRLQDNHQTGEQALAALFPARVAREAERVASPPVAVSGVAPGAATAEALAGALAGGLHLAGIVTAPTPQTPVLPEPGAAREIATMAGKDPLLVGGHQGGPAMAGPTPAPTPGLGEILAAQAASKTASKTGPLVAPEEEGDNSIDNGIDTRMVPPVGFRERMIKALEPASQPEVLPGTVMPDRASPDEVARDTAPAAGESQPPALVEPPAAPAADAPSGAD